jgi:glucosamine-6-phosphate deaminase
VEENHDAVSVKCGGIIAEQINNGRVIGFATGETPIGAYNELIKMYREGAVDFSRITSFNLDEYYPLEKSDVRSFDYYMRNTLFNHVNMNMDNFNIPNCEAQYPEKECADYENKIKAAGGIDFQILGLGDNGHIGFNEPGDSFPTLSHLGALTGETIKANARFYQSIDEVPKKCLTMGIKTIMMADKILLIASGKAKAIAVKNAILGPITPKAPASALLLHKDVTIVVDKNAASCLGF